MCWVTSGQIESLECEDFRKTLHLWILVEKLCLGNLQDHVMDMWRSFDRSLDRYYTAEEAQYIFEKTPTKSLPRQYVAHMIRYQSLRPPAKNGGCTISPRGDPIPFSDVSAAALSKFLAKNEEILEHYLEAGGKDISPVITSDPRSKSLSCTFHQHPRFVASCPSGTWNI